VLADLYKIRNAEDPAPYDTTKMLRNQAMKDK